MKNPVYEPLYTRDVKARLQHAQLVPFVLLGTYNFRSGGQEQSWSVARNENSSVGGKMKKLIALLIGCFALVLASTVRAQNPPGVNNAELNGDYAFNFDGITGSGGVSSVFAAVGRFRADGAGNLTNGEIDTNSVGAGAAVAQAFTGTYAIGADHRGVMTLAGARFAFAMIANGNAQFIKFDAGGGSGTIGSGTMEKVDTTAYNTAKISGAYAFGVAGLDNLNNRAAIVGRFASNGAGTLTNAAGDANLYGTNYSLSFTAANYTVSDPATGRGAMNLAFSLGGAPQTLNFVFYIVNAGKMFAMERDAVTSSTPLLNGVVLQQSAGGFSNAALSGNMVTYLTGLSICGNGTGAVPKAVAGLLTADGNGGFTLSFDENYCRNFGTYPNVPGTYSVASNGRASLTVGWADFVAYLVSLNQAFLLFTPDSNVLYGFGEAQAAGLFTNGAMKGTYAGYASTPATFGVVVSSGEFTADGANPTGNISGTQDIGASSGPTSDVAFNATYSVSSSPTNGRGAMTVSSGTGGGAVVYVISTSKFVTVSTNDPNPAVMIFEQSSPLPTLSSLTLNPTSVIGGAQSSTGTVTLSAPAPAGGAQIVLSSSNTGAASVPSSVTVAAGATSATFTTSTSAVAASTSVTISAAYGGVTQTASLTLTPSQGPTLSSLTLSPSSVTGGNSSTGTVTLNGPALAGGVQVTLSSSNTGVATVPSSVTVPAGSTSATFTVNTSTVLFSTSVTISASYGAVSKSATLRVNSVGPLL